MNFMSFQIFMGSFSFEHSSPRTPNAFAEAMVGVVKGILSKAMSAGEDPHLALQAYRATPFSSGLCSPAEMPLRETITHQRSCKKNKAQQKVHYDRTSREYEELYQHEPVLVQLVPHTRLWTKARVVVSSKEFPRSYIIQTEDGGQFRRNRRQIKPRVTTPNPRTDAEVRTNNTDVKETVLQESCEIPPPKTELVPNSCDVTSPRHSMRTTKGLPPIVIVSKISPFPCVYRDPRVSFVLR